MLPVQESSRRAFDMLSLIRPTSKVSLENTHLDFNSNTNALRSGIDPDRNLTEFFPKKSFDSIGGSHSAFTALKTDRGHLGSYGVLNTPKDEEIPYKRLHLDTFSMNRIFPVTSVFAGIMQRRKRRENRIRRQRTTFTSEQTLKLEVEYNRSEYISRPRRYELAEILNLSESQIKIWFQNRRAKEKRIEKAHVDHQLRNCESVSSNLAPGFPVSNSYMFYGSCAWPYPPSTMNDIYQDAAKGS